MYPLCDQLHQAVVGLGLGDRTADFARAADEVGIVVRPFAGEGARVTIGETEANDRLVELVAKWVPGTS